MVLRYGDVNPEMITLARKSRRKTQAQLAEDIGVTQSTISKCEAGVMSVNESVLTGLADALGYPPHFFQQHAAVQGPAPSELFHRKRATLGTLVLHQAYALAEVRRLEVAKLLEASSSSTRQTPLMPIDEFDDDPAQIARTVRALWQVPPGPVFNATRTLERGGCIVVAHDFATRLLDGFSCRSAGLPPIFHLNRSLPPDRWRWTLAHELGHVVMHVDAVESPKLMEEQADSFAGEFLAPAHELKPMLWDLNYERLAALKREWKISMQALTMRAYSLEAITESRRRELFIGFSKAGFRRREPANLDPPIETPEALFDLAKFHMTRLEFTRDDLKVHLAVGEDDFHRYYHDPHDVLN